METIRRQIRLLRAPFNASFYTHSFLFSLSSSDACTNCMMEVALAAWLAFSCFTGGCIYLGYGWGSVIRFSTRCTTGLHIMKGTEREIPGRNGRKTAVRFIFRRLYHHLVTTGHWESGWDKSASINHIYWRPRRRETTTSINIFVGSCSESAEQGRDQVFDVQCPSTSTYIVCLPSFARYVPCFPLPTARAHISEPGACGRNQTPSSLPRYFPPPHASFPL